MKQTISQRIEALAGELGISVRTAWLWRREGCPIDDAEQAREWALRRGKNAVSSPQLTAAREELRREQIRKLKFANDESEARLISRAWVAERLQRALGELAASRAKLEHAQATRIDAVGTDVAKVRTAVRGVWDEIFCELQALSKHFEEQP